MVKKPNLKKLGRKGLELVPIAGEVIDNLDSEEGGKGKLAWNKLIFQAIRIGLAILAGSKGIEIAF